MGGVVDALDGGRRHDGQCGRTEADAAPADGDQGRTGQAHHCADAAARTGAVAEERGGEQDAEDRRGGHQQAGRAGRDYPLAGVQ